MTKDNSDVVNNYDTFPFYNTPKQNIPLNGFHIKVLLLSRDKVWSHNAYFQASGDTPREHTTECIEATLVRGGDHLGDVHHQGRLRVTVLDT